MRAVVLCGAVRYGRRRRWDPVRAWARAGALSINYSRATFQPGTVRDLNQRGAENGQSLVGNGLIAFDGGTGDGAESTPHVSDL